MEDLMVEATQIYGEDVYYIVRDTEEAVDLIFGEDPTSKFEKTFLMEMFVASVENWSSGGDFFSKFGISVNEATNLVVPRRTFEKYVPSSIAIRPREGDLIWIPVMGYLFEIKFVEHENEYFQLGRRIPMLYELKIERYIFSNEEFDTGIDEIDQIERDMSYVIRLHLNDATGNSSLFRAGEYVYQGANLATASAKAEVINFNPANNTLDIIDIVGVFTTTEAGSASAFTDGTIFTDGTGFSDLSGNNVIGATSGANMQLQSVNDLEDHSPYQNFINDELEVEADLLLDTSENNPFGII
jgi:hypothetical protein